MEVTIYKIENILNSKLYIGSTIDYKKRKKEHVFKLNKGNHHSKKLQNAWKKYGSENFRFDIIGSFKTEIKEERFKIEKDYIIKHNSFNNGYNMTMSTSNPSWDDLPTSLKKEIARKISNNHKGKVPKNLNIMRKSRWRPIIMIENDEIIKEYASCGEAGRDLDIDYRYIDRMCKGLVKKMKIMPTISFKYKTDLYAVS